jgi:hypothetical protein
MIPHMTKTAIAKRPRGRPSTYDPEIAAEICALIPSHRTRISDLLATDERFPCETTFYKWLMRHEDFAVIYTRAREARTQLMEEEILEISDEVNGDAYVEYDKDGQPFAKLDGEAIQRSKLKVETRKWLMAKLQPRKYGDKVDVTSGGEKLAAPPATVMIDARMQSLVAIAQRRAAEQTDPEDTPLIDLDPSPSIEDLMS